jgi:hypothetical protein
LDVEDLNDEIVVYDRTSDQVHLLSASTAEIWRLCNGERRNVDIVDALNGQDNSLTVVDSALAELDAFDLLEQSQEAEASPRPMAIHRRAFLTKAADTSLFVGATIVTLGVPHATQALTLNQVDCSPPANKQACKDFCNTACGTDSNTCRLTDTNQDFNCVGIPSNPSEKLCRINDANTDPLKPGTCNCELGTTPCP